MKFTIIFVAVILAFVCGQEFQSVLEFGDKEKAKYHARIQQCGCVDCENNHDNNIAYIRSECEKNYPGEFYFTVSKDAETSGGGTGNLEMSLELMGKPQEKLWIHQKMGKNQGCPKSDWEEFDKRLRMSMIKLTRESPSGAITGLVFTATSFILVSALI